MDKKYTEVANPHGDDDHAVHIPFDKRRIGGNWMENHPLMEKYYKIDNDHVIVDKKDWEEALEILRGYQKVSTQLGAAHRHEIIDPGHSQGYLKTDPVEYKVWQILQGKRPIMIGYKLTPEQVLRIRKVMSPTSIEDCLFFNRSILSRISQQEIEEYDINPIGE